MRVCPTLLVVFTTVVVAGAGVRGSMPVNVGAGIQGRPLTCLGPTAETKIFAPGASHATVTLVDEGVLNLTRHSDPVPPGFLPTRRPRKGRGADMGGISMNWVRIEPGVLIGADGGSGLFSRGRPGTGSIEGGER